MTENLHDEETIRRLREILLVEEELSLGARSRFEAGLAEHHRGSLAPSGGAIAVIATIAMSITLLVRAIPVDAWSMAFIGLCAVGYAMLVSRGTAPGSPPPPNRSGTHE